MRCRGTRKCLSITVATTSPRTPASSGGRPMRTPTQVKALATVSRMWSWILSRRSASTANRSGPWTGQAFSSICHALSVIAAAISSTPTLFGADVMASAMRPLSRGGGVRRQSLHSVPHPRSRLVLGPYRFAAAKTTLRTSGASAAGSGTTCGGLAGLGSAGSMTGNGRTGEAPVVGNCRRLPYGSSPRDKGIEHCGQDPEPIGRSTLHCVRSSANRRTSKTSSSSSRATTSHRPPSERPRDTPINTEIESGSVTAHRPPGIYHDRTFTVAHHHKTRLRLPPMAGRPIP